jgi:hypothetical protein
MKKAILTLSQILFIGASSGAVIAFVLDQNEQGNPVGRYVLITIVITGLIIGLDYEKKGRK